MIAVEDKGMRQDCFFTVVASCMDRRMRLVVKRLLKGVTPFNLGLRLHLETTLGIGGPVMTR